MNVSAYKIWILALSAAYLLHAAILHLHRIEMRGLIEQFNRVAAEHGAPPIVESVGAIDRDFRWIAVAIVPCFLGAFWAIPMALAGAMQRRYINVTSKHLREDAAARLKQMLGSQLDLSDPQLQLPRRVCRRPTCRATLPQSAEFCPRCGRAVVPMADVS